MVYDVARFPSPNLDLTDLLELAESMRAAGILRSYGKSGSTPDEPPLLAWHARYRDGEESQASGSAVEDERHALVTTIAEALERHLWFETVDYFQRPVAATVRQIERAGRFVRPESFAGYSEEQRLEHPHLRITPESIYSWIRAVSLLKKEYLFIPTQIISAHHDAKRLVHKRVEPVLRRTVTTGLGTHPVREEALLSGALEIIERDAYMIMWLNQLTLPRIDLDDLSAQSHSLKILLDRCARYRLRPHVVRMLTDAPAYAFCAIIEDETGLEPRVTIGMKSHRDPAVCAEKALTEALRARRGTRNLLANFTDADRNKTAREIGHYDRLTYWATGDRYTKLAFLHQGTLQKLTREVWEKDTAGEHLERIVKWCIKHNYTCVSVPFTSSKKNIPGWHIEMVVIPELQPLGYEESVPYIGGRRLTDIPKMSGYTPRKIIFTGAPHPFA